MAGARAQDLGGARGLLRGSPAAMLLLALLFAANSSFGTLVYISGQIEAGAPLWVIDFPSFHMAADSVFNRGMSPYTEATRSLYRQALGFPVFPFLYPPYALPALYPLSWLDYTSGMFVLLAINTVAAGALFCLLHRMFLAGIKSATAYWAALFLLFVGSSVRETIFVGQVNLFAALSLLLAWQLLRAGARPILAGVLIGVAIVTKTYFVLLLLMFLPRLEWRPILGAAIAVLGVALCAATVVPVSLWGEWLIEVAPSGRYGATPFPELPNLFSGNQSINSALIRLLGFGETAGMLGLVLAGALLAATCIVLWRHRRDAAIGYFDAAMPVMLVTIYLVAPLSWMHHLVFVMPALLRLWADVADRGELKEMLLVAAVGAWIGFPWPLPQLEDVSPYLTLIPVPGIVALWVLSLHRMLKPTAEAQDRPGRFPLLQPVRADEARGGAAGGLGR